MTITYDINAVKAKLAQFDIIYKDEHFFRCIRSLQEFKPGTIFVSAITDPDEPNGLSVDYNWQEELQMFEQFNNNPEAIIYAYRCFMIDCQKFNHYISPEEQIDIINESTSAHCLSEYGASLVHMSLQCDGHYFELISELDPSHVLSKIKTIMALGLDKI
jgi:hypothetical protein